MKKFLNRAFLALFAVTTLTFTACDDDDTKDTVIGGINYGDDYVKINGVKQLVNEDSTEPGGYDAATQTGTFVLQTVSDVGGTAQFTNYKFSFTSPEQVKRGDKLSDFALVLVTPEGNVAVTSGSAVVTDIDRDYGDQDITVRFDNLKMGDTTFHGSAEVNYAF